MNERKKQNFIFKSIFFVFIVFTVFVIIVFFFIISFSIVVECSPSSSSSTTLSFLLFHFIIIFYFLLDFCDRLRKYTLYFRSLIGVVDDRLSDYFFTNGVADLGCCNMYAFIGRRKDDTRTRKTKIMGHRLRPTKSLVNYNLYLFSESKTLCESFHYLLNQYRTYHIVLLDPEIVKKLNITIIIIIKK